MNSLSRVSKICVWGWRLLGVFHDRFNEGIESSVIMLAGVYVDVVFFAYRKMRWKLSSRKFVEFTHYGTNIKICTLRLEIAQKPCIV